MMVVIGKESEKRKDKCTWNLEAVDTGILCKAMG